MAWLPANWTAEDQLSSMVLVYAPWVVLCKYWLLGSKSQAREVLYSVAEATQTVVVATEGAS